MEFKVTLVPHKQVSQTFGVTAYHYSFGITTKRILQKPSELRISVRYVSGFTVCKCRNNISQGCKRKVNFIRFVQPLSLGSSLGLPFRALK